MFPPSSAAGSNGTGKNNQEHTTPEGRFLPSESLFHAPLSSRRMHTNIISRNTNPGGDLLLGRPSMVERSATANSLLTDDVDHVSYEPQGDHPFLTNDDSERSARAGGGEGPPMNRIEFGVPQQQQLSRPRHLGPTTRSRSIEFGAPQQQQQQLSRPRHLGPTTRSMSNSSQNSMMNETRGYAASTRSLGLGGHRKHFPGQGTHPPFPTTLAAAMTQQQQQQQQQPREQIVASSSSLQMLATATSLKRSSMAMPDNNHNHPHPHSNNEPTVLPVVGSVATQPPARKRARTEALLRYGGLVEAKPGKFVRLVGTDRARNAIARGKAKVVKCQKCVHLFQVHHGARVLYCRGCQHFTPLIPELPPSTTTTTKYSNHNNHNNNTILQAQRV